MPFLRPSESKSACMPPTLVLASCAAASPASSSRHDTRILAVIIPLIVLLQPSLAFEKIAVPVSRDSPFQNLDNPPASFRVLFNIVQIGRADENLEAGIFLAGFALFPLVDCGKLFLNLFFPLLQKGAPVCFLCHGVVPFPPLGFPILTPASLPIRYHTAKMNGSADFN